MVDIMKIAVLGKGGSGKSSVSWLLAQTLRSRKEEVLLLDVDYNTDLAGLCGYTQESTVNFFNSALADFDSYIGRGAHMFKKFDELFTLDPLPKFHFPEMDALTKKYLVPNRTNFPLMVAGDIHPELIYGNRCSHSYLNHIPYYLAFLELGEKSHVIIDSIAGIDLIANGFFLGVDVIVVVVEPTVQSLGVFRSVQKVAFELGIPVFAIGNKVSESRAFSEVDKKDLPLIGIVPYDEAVLQAREVKISKEVQTEMSNVVEVLLGKSFDSGVPLQRFKAFAEKKATLQKKHA
jgi:CO dehydrogenase maturation factor